MDPPSWSLTLSIAQQVKHILMVIALRPMTDKTTAEKYSYSQILHLPKSLNIQLSNLGQDDTAELIAQLLNIKSVPSKVAKEIHKRGKGSLIKRMKLSYRKSILDRRNCLSLAIHWWTSNYQSRSVYHNWGY